MMPKQIDLLAAERNRLFLENKRLKDALSSVHHSIRGLFQAPGLPPRARRFVEKELKNTLVLVEQLSAGPVAQN